MKRPGVSWKISANRRNLRWGALICKRFEFFVFPPRFGPGGIGDQASIRAGDKAGAENIELHFGTAPFQCEDRIVFAILQRLALLIESGVAQTLTVIFVAERY